MAACRCGCDRPVKPGRMYASVGCVHRTITLEQRQAWGSKGGRIRTANFLKRLIDQCKTLPIEAAIVNAYHIGYKRAFQDKRAPTPTGKPAGRPRAGGRNDASSLSIQATARRETRDRVPELPEP